MALATYASHSALEKALGLNISRKAGFKKGSISKEERAQLGKAKKGYHWTEWMVDGKSVFAQYKDTGGGNFIKKVGRTHATVFAKTAKVVTPILSAAATVFAGPAAGLAITAAGAAGARYAGATAARAKGLKGLEAREKGRSLMKQVLKYGALGTGVGAAAGVIAGGSLLTGLAGATATQAAPAAGTVAASVAPSSGSIVTSLAPTALTAGASQLQNKAAPKVPGGSDMGDFVTYSELAESISNPGAQAADNGILGDASKLFQTGLTTYASIRGQQQTKVPQAVDSDGDGIIDTPTGAAGSPGVMDYVAAIPGPIKLVGVVIVGYFAWKSMKKRAG